MSQAAGEIIHVEASPDLMWDARSGPYDLMQAMAEAGSHALAASGLPLPQVGWSVAETLEARTAVLTFGLERFVLHTESLFEIPQILYQKHCEISAPGMDQAWLSHLLEHGIEDARHQDLDGAFQKCYHVYYLAWIQGFEIEIVAALNVAGSLALPGNFDSGLQLLSTAAFYANHSGTVPPDLRAQVNLNAGNAWLSAGDPQQAIGLFDAAFAAAQEPGSEIYLVLALTAYAEASQQLGDPATAQQVLAYCRDLITPAPGEPAHPAAVEVHQSIEALHFHVSSGQSGHEVHSWFDRLKESLVSLVPHALISAVVFKCMSLRGEASALLSIGGTRIENAIFRGATVIGENGKILAKLERLV